MTNGTDKYTAVVTMIDLNAPYVAGLIEPHMLPIGATIKGTVNTVAVRRTLAIVGLTGTNPNEVGILLRDRYVTNRRGRLIIKNRLEGGCLLYTSDAADE